MIENRLSELMGKRRLKVQDVARGTGLAYKTVLKLYHDRNDSFDREVLARLCAYLEVGIGELLVYVPTNQPEGSGSVSREPAGTGGL